MVCEWMNEVQKISQNWPACHKMEMVHNGCLNTFVGVVLSSKMLAFFYRVLRDKGHFTSVIVCFYFN